MNKTASTYKTNNTSKSVSSKGPKKIYTREEMEEMESKLQEAWKSYGRDNDVGRDLYKLYGKHHKPKIDVPVPRTEPWDWKTANIKEKRPCPQTTKIEYPKVVTKSDLMRAKIASKFSKLDTIPKRKQYKEILQELAELKKERAAYVPIKKGVDRAGMINTLQDKFKYSNTAKGPQLSPEEEAKIQQAVEAQMRRVAKKNYFGTQGLVAPAPTEDVAMRPHDKEKFESQELQDLNDLFDEVIKEIEERQEYLGEVEGLDMDGAKDKVKQEIVSRVAELQKINKMIKDEKTRLSKEK